jgi:hypothetical protein
LVRVANGDGVRRHVQVQVDVVGEGRGAATAVSRTRAVPTVLGA